MLEHRFDEIIDFLCSGILSKIEREEMRDELYDHLMTKSEINLAVGMDEEKAADEAINALGNREKLKDSIAKVHKSAPSQTLKSALNCLVFSFIFLAIALLTSFNQSEVTAVAMFCGLITGLFSLYSMRKIKVCDKNGFSFKNLFVFYCIWFVITIVCYALSPIEILDDIFDEHYSGLIAFGVMVFPTLIALIWNLIKPYNKQLADSAMHYFIYLGAIFAGTIVFLIFNLFGFFIDYQFISSELIFKIIIILFAFVLIVTAVWISRISQSLYEVKHNYIVETSFKKKMIIVGSFALISLVLIGTVDGLYLCRTPETKPYSVEDYSFESQEEYKRICDNLISFGVPENIVSLLPASEIATYSETVSFSEMSQSAKDVYLNRNTKSDLYERFELPHLLAEELTVKPDFYAIPVHTVDGVNYVRVLTVFDVSITDDYFKTYRDGIFFEYSADNMSFSEQIIESDDFLMILQKNPESFEFEQVKPYRVSYYNYIGPVRIKGFEFKPEDEMIIVSSKTLKFDDLYETKGELNIEYIHKMTPFSLLLRTAEDVFESSEESCSGYIKKNEVFRFCFAMPDRTYG